MAGFQTGLSEKQNLQRRLDQTNSRIKFLTEIGTLKQKLAEIDQQIEKAEAEKKKAAERAKMLDEMDDEFGVGKIVEEETQRRGGQLLGMLVILVTTLSLISCQSITIYITTF